LYVIEHLRMLPIGVYGFAKFYFAHFLTRKILLCALFGSQNFTLHTFWLVKCTFFAFYIAFTLPRVLTLPFEEKSLLKGALYTKTGSPVFFLRTFWLAEFVLFALFGSRFFTSCYLLFVTYLLFVIFFFCLKLHCLVRFGKK
jgi:hypothetical protein